VVAACAPHDAFTPSPADSVVAPLVRRILFAASSSRDSTSLPRSRVRWGPPLSVLPSCSGGEHVSAVLTGRDLGRSRGDPLLPWTSAWPHDPYLFLSLAHGCWRVIYVHAIKKVAGYAHAMEKFSHTCMPCTQNSLTCMPFRPTSEVTVSTRHVK
jgi:hypothetical protein